MHGPTSRGSGPPAEPGRGAAPRSTGPEGPGELLLVEWEDGAVRGRRSGLSDSALASVGGKGWAAQDRLDLHGVRVHELDALVGPFVKAAGERGLSRVLFIHGKGTHSPNGAGVLCEALVRILADTRVAQRVRAFRTAPARLGGTGALCVELGRGRRG